MGLWKAPKMGRGLAYFLSENADGAWAWSVCDEDGLTVAEGHAASHAAAMAAIEQVMRTQSAAA